MDEMFERIKHLRDGLVYPAIRAGDPLVLERSRQTVSGVLGIMPLVLFSAFLYARAGLDELVVPVFTTGLLLMLALPLSRFLANHHISANWSIGALVLGLTWTGLLTGGLLSPILWWCLPIPLLAGNTSGARAAKVWVGIMLTLLVGIWVWAPLGLEPDLEFGTTVLEVLVISTMVAVLLMVLSAYLSFEVTQRVLLGELCEVNAALSEAHMRAEQKVVNLSEQKLVTDRALADTRASLRDLSDSSSLKSDLLRMVSHDLRSPLSEIMGLTTLMNDEVPAHETKLARYLHLMEQSSQRMRDLLEGLLNLARVENGVMDPTWQTLDAGDLVYSIVTDFETRANSKGIVLKATVDELPMSMVTDMTMFMQILQNLISNAVKYSFHDTMVRIDARSDEDYLWICVSDEGPGISPADQRRMFQPFARLSARPTAGETSTGLGLSIVKTLVASIEGVIECKSALGMGTTFEVRLPREPVQLREMLAG